MKFNKKYLIWLAVALVGLIVIGVVIGNLVRRVNEARQQPSEMLVQVERGDLEVWVTGNGTVGAAVAEAVRTRMAGTIETYLLEDELAVVAGQKLVTLELQDLSTQIELKELDLARLERERKNLKDEKTTVTVQAPQEGTVTWLVKVGEKVKSGTPIALIHSTPEESVTAPLSASGTWTITNRMVEEGLTALVGQPIAELKDQDRADQINYQLSLNDIQLEQARLELAELKRQQQQNREDSVIYAPINGTVVLPEPSTADVGVSVPQGTLLATIVDYSRLQVVIPVDELDINKVEAGQTVRITADALPGQAIAGEVTRVSSTGRILGGVAAFDVTVAIEPVEGLKVGMNVSAAILVDLRADTLLVPIEAVFEQEGESMVMVLAEEPEPGKSPTQPVKVVTGAHNTSSIEILSGVTEGQQIIIQGSSSELETQRGMMFGSGQEGNGQ
ncbi:MAG: efflux RND transporter periplasmic adaptor subunit [Bacillota bacterium]